MLTLRRIAPLGLACLALACSLDDLSNGTRPPDGGVGAAGGGQGGAGGSPTTTTTTTSSGGGGGAGGGGPSGPCVSRTGSSFSWICGFGNPSDQGTVQQGDIGALRLASWSGGVVLAARVYGALDFGGGPLGSPELSRENVLAAVFSPGGEYLRGVEIQGSATTKALGGVAVSPAGRIAITGHFQGGTVEIGGATLTAQAGAADGFVAVFEPDGAATAVHIKGAPGDEARSQRPYAAAFDAAGNLVIGGEFYRSLVVVDPTGAEDCTLTGDTAGSSDAFVVQLDPGLKCLRALGFGGGTNGNYADAVLALVATPGGDVLAGGFFRGSVTLGAQMFTNNGSSEDGLVVKLDPTLTPLWAARFGDTYTADRVRHLAVDGDAVYLTGYHQGALTLGACPTVSASLRNIVAARLALDDGACAWARTLGGSGLDEGRSVAAAAGSVNVAGYFVAQMALGGDAGSLTSTGGEDAFVARIDPVEGTALSALGKGSTGTDAVEGIAATADGTAVYIAGSYAGSFDALPEVNQAEDFFLARLPLSP